MGSEQQAILDKVWSFRRVWSTDAALIRDDAQLTTAGKQQKIAELKDEANRALQQLRADYDAAGVAAVDASMKRAFGHSSSSDVLTLRDAAVRAQQLENEEDAAALLATALRQSDEALAKEVALRAIDQRWSKPVSDYAAAKPSLDDDVQVVWDASAPWSWRDGFNDVAMAFSDLAF